MRTLSAPAGGGAHNEPMRKDDPRIAAVREWYTRVVPVLDVIGPGDLIASWRGLVRPIGWPIDGPPSAEQFAAHRERYLQDVDGGWWVFPGLIEPRPSSDPAVVVLSIDASGPAVLTATSATRDREAALRLLPQGEDAGLQSIRAFVAETFPSGRREGASTRTGDSWRSGHSAAVLARALFCAALVGQHVPHREAVRIWMRCEHELHGPLDNVDYFEALVKRHSRLWRTFEDEVCATNRRVLRELPASLHPSWA